MPETTTIVNTAPAVPPLATEIGTPPPVKPGWQTTEFWMKLAAILLSTLFASGAITNNTVLAVAGMAAAILGSLGYAVNRGMVKAAASKGAVVTASVQPVMRTLAPVLAVLVLAFSAPACGPAAPIIATGGQIVVDCVSQNRDQIEALVGAFWNAITNGASWSTVEQQAIANGETLGGCAFAEVVQKFLAPPPGRAAPPAAEGQAARRALEDFRTKHARGATFHTPAGNL
jgi:hypothetical protein